MLFVFIVILFFSIKNTSNELPNEIIENQQANEITIVGKTKNNKTYKIKSLKGIKISDNEYFFENVFCTQDQITLIASKAYLDINKKEVTLKDNVSINFLNYSASTDCLYFDYKNERIYGENKTFFKHYDMYRITNANCLGFEYANNMLFLKDKVEIISKYIGPL